MEEQPVGTNVHIKNPLYDIMGQDKRNAGWNQDQINGRYAGEEGSNCFNVGEGKIFGPYNGPAAPMDEYIKGHMMNRSVYTSYGDAKDSGKTAPTSKYIIDKVRKP